MHSPKAFVLRTAGTNCDGETVDALERAGARAELLHLERLAAEPARLDEAELVVLPGGFSYGDDVAAGRVFGLELRHLLPEALSAFVERGGFVLGICNGFQVLVEAGLLEPRGAERTIALTGNASNRFECRWVTLRSEASACPWLVAGEVWPVPVAHAEGRFVVKDAAALERLEANGQIALRYVARDGGAPGRLDNPNGSQGDIAGVCDPTGRVLGLMPHPERNVNPWNHPYWTRLPARDEGEGLAFFRRMVDAAASQRSGTPV
jgi:phosphoribosylformylglycinamidine synthase